MSTGRRPGRPTIYEEAMTPIERQRRWRAKAREAEALAKARTSRAEASVAPPPRRYLDGKDRFGCKLSIERHAYVTLLAPVNELAAIAEVEGKVTELLEQMSPDQRVGLGRCARCAIAVVAILAEFPDDQRLASPPPRDPFAEAEANGRKS